MATKLYYNTVSPLLMSVLQTLMQSDVFKPFRLVGGTSLSLQLGHRLSVDIDLFTDAPYESIDFTAIDSYLKETYPYVDSHNYAVGGFGKSYFVGNSKEECIKLDVYYTDPFFDEILLGDGIRLATVKEIIAMKLDVIMRGGRKKDFWDIHEAIDQFSLNQMVEFHQKRYPYTHDEKEIKDGLVSFSSADEDYEPICLKGKYWELVKLDLIDFIRATS